MSPLDREISVRRKPLQGCLAKTTYLGDAVSLIHGNETNTPFDSSHTLDKTFIVKPLRGTI
jgi:hypothetical protein